MPNPPSSRAWTAWPSSDVGSGGADYGEGTIRYMRVLGRINRLLARRADSVAELVCGLAQWLKGGPP